LATPLAHCGALEFLSMPRVLPYNEKLVENAIRDDPEFFVGERWTLASQQEQIMGFRPDLLFRDENGRLVIVEVQLNALDRNHLYRALEYRDLTHHARGEMVAEVVVVCNQISPHHQPIAAAHGIRVLELDKAEFITKYRQRYRDRKVVTKPRRHARNQPVTAAWLLDQIARSSPPLKPHDVIDPDDKVVFWHPFWDDPRDDTSYLHHQDLRGIDNPGAAYYSHVDRWARTRKSKAKKGNIFYVPKEIIIAPDIFTIWSDDQCKRIKDWLDLIGHLWDEDTGFTAEYILGVRSNFEILPYEDYIRGQIRRFAAVRNDYGRDVGYDSAQILSDLALLRNLLIRTGKFPRFRDIPITTSVKVDPGGGSLEARRRNSLQSWSVDHRDEWARRWQSERDEWLTVRIGGNTSAYLPVVADVLWHRPHASIAPRAKLRLSKCHRCLIEPRLLSTLRPRELSISARFFMHAFSGEGA
jgi:hypothetical protein